MTTDVTDEDVFARLSMGDREACLILFHRHYAQIEAYARLLLGEAATAEEIVGATFQHAYRAPARLKVGRGLSCLGLLLQHCRSLIYPMPATDNGNAAMQPGGEDRLHAPEQPGSPVPFESVPLESVPFEDMMVDRGRLKAALHCLSPADREIIHLAFIPGLTRYDIAILTSKPSLDAVSSHLFHAMQRLAVCLERQNGVRC